MTPRFTLSHTSGVSFITDRAHNRTTLVDPVKGQLTPVSTVGPEGSNLAYAQSLNDRLNMLDEMAALCKDVVFIENSGADTVALLIALKRLAVRARNSYVGYAALEPSREPAQGEG